MTLTRKGKLDLLLAALGTLTIVAVLVTGHPLPARVLAALLAGVAYAGLAMLLRRRLDRDDRLVVALTDGIASLRDNDFSVSIAPQNEQAPLDGLVDAYNGLGDMLRRQRQDIHQRELLLDTVIQATPLALVLTNANGAIVYGNLAARQLFGAGKKLEGHSLPALLERVPAALRAAMSEDRDALFTVETKDDSEVFHLSQRRFALNGQVHRLALLKQLTREINAREVATWKRVIRVIAHEINNSVAPIASLAQSGERLAAQPDEAQLRRVFLAIEERMAHLAGFVDGYSRFAKLPKPRPERVEWRTFFDGLSAVAPFGVSGALPDHAGWFDATQLQQVLLNLLKNASEAGSGPDKILIAVTPKRNGHLVEVHDRGTGMSDEVLRNALVPFYSTKSNGTGLGLTLCREIVEAHGGTLDLANRPGGGVTVRLWLPDSDVPAANA